ncbi:MAG: hypothetical protein ACR2NC_00775, partial [Thermodesulfobacteriota bacterium]
MSYHLFNDIYTYLKKKWWGKPFVIILVILVVLFTLWNSLPDTSKERMLTSEPNTDIPVTENNVELISASFYNWQTFREEELQQIKWGYKVDLLGIPENNNGTKLYGLPTILEAFDFQEMRYYPEIRAITIEEFNEKVRKSQGLPSTIEPRKRYEILWKFQNISKDPVLNLKIAIDEQMPDTGFWSEERWSKPINVKSGETFTKISLLYSPIQDLLPDILNFRIQLEYNYKNEKVRATLPVYYQYKSGTFNIV